MKEIQCADGGAMLEIYRSAGWGQINVRIIPPGTRVGGHRHPKSNERWLLLRGNQVTIELEGRPNFPMKTWTPMVVLAGTGHALDNGGAQEAVLLYWRDRLYEENNPDKEEWTCAF